MKFKDLSVNQTFTMIEYPDCLAIKIKFFGGSCCSPKHNAKIICDSQEKIVYIEDEQDVFIVAVDSNKEETNAEVATIKESPHTTKIGPIMVMSNRGGGTFGGEETKKKEEK